MNIKVYKSFEDAENQRQGRSIDNAGKVDEPPTSREMEQEYEKRVLSMRRRLSPGETSDQFQRWAEDFNARHGLG